MTKQLNTVVKSGKTVEEAVQEGLKALAVDPDEVKIEILSEAKSGFLGVFGAKDAVVRLSLKNDAYQDLLEKEKKEWDDHKKKTTHFESIEKPIKKIPPAKKIVEAHGPKNQEEKNVTELPLPVIDLKKEEEEAKKPSRVKDVFTPDQEKKKEEQPDLSQKAEDQSEKESTPSLRIDELLKAELSKESQAPILEEKEQETEKEEGSLLEASIRQSLKEEEKKEETKKEEIREEGEEDDDLEPVDLLAPEEVFSAGKEWLEKILSEMHIEAALEGSEKEGNLYYEIVEISDSDTGIIIGRRGETLNALQYLLSVSLNQQTRDHYRIFVDVGGYRIRRKAKIEKMACRNAEKVQKTHRKMSLEPMNAYERRIVHTALQGMANIVTVSEGRDPNRRVVIRYKG